MRSFEVVFDQNPRTAVTVDVPEGSEPLDHIAHRIARELNLLRFEVQIGDHGGSIRRIGDVSHGTAFTIAQV